MDALDLLALLAAIAVHALLCLITRQSFQILSPWATSCVEEVASTGPGIRFFQLYVSLIYILHFPLLVSDLNCILSVFFMLHVVDDFTGHTVQVYRNRHVVAHLVRRAERAGFKAIALTVDTPRLGRREADIKNRSVIVL